MGTVLKYTGMFLYRPARKAGPLCMPFLSGSASFYTDPHVRRVRPYRSDPEILSFYTDPHVRRVLMVTGYVAFLVGFYTDPHVRRVR